jgi:hypothetical protein
VAAPVAPSQDPISDDWKKKFFGSVDSPDADPNADPDHDGSPNWQEFLAGTDPTDANSHLHLNPPQARVQNGKKHLALNWLSAPGKKYVIETTTDLGQGKWNVISSGLAGDGNVQQFIDANTLQGTQYYRVRLQN